MFLVKLKIRFLIPGGARGSSAHLPGPDTCRQPTIAQPQLDCHNWTATFGAGNPYPRLDGFGALETEVPELSER